MIYRRVLSSFVWQLSVLITLGVLLYTPSLSFGFIWDDYVYILQNPLMKNSSGILDIWLTDKATDFWPISYTFYWIQKQVFGFNPFGYRLVNLILFLASTAFLLLLLRQLKLRSAFFISLIYILHPMNVEVVAWLFQQKTNLANLFGIICAVCWIRYVNSQNNQRIRYYCISIFMFICSLLSKVSLLGLPILLFGYIHYKQHSNKKLEGILATIPFFFLSLMLGLMNVFWRISQNFEYEKVLDTSWVFRLWLVGQTYFFYFLKSFFPWPNMFVYEKWNVRSEELIGAVPFLVLLVVVIISIKEVLKKKVNKIYLSFLISFCLLFPVLGISQIYYMKYSFVADHWLTLGLVSFLFPAVESIYCIKWGKLFLVGVCSVFFYSSFQYSKFYESEKKLFLHSYNFNANSELVNRKIADAYIKNGQYKLALETLKKIARLNPESLKLKIEMGNLELKIGNYTGALKFYDSVLNKNPKYSIAYYNKAVVYSSLKNYRLAIRYYLIASRLDPSDVQFQRGVYKTLMTNISK